MAALDPFYSDQILGFEGFSPKATWDYKQNSNGYGTKAQYPGEVIDQDTAKQRFDAEVGKAAASVDAVIPQNTPPGVRAALTSLTYNAGPGWINAGLGDAVKAGDWDAAQAKFTQYNKAGGQVNPGLVNRRNAEAAWFGQAGPLPPATDVASLPPPGPPIAGPQSLEPQKPLPPQPLNLAAAPQSFQPQGPLPPQLLNLAAQQFQGLAPQAQPAQPMEMPQAAPLDAPDIQQVIRKINLAKAFQKIPVPQGFRGYQVS